MQGTASHPNKSNIGTYSFIGRQRECIVKRGGKKEENLKPKSRKILVEASS